MSNHAVVWIDHHEARVFEYAAESLHSEVVKAHAHGPGRRRHETQHAEADAQFYQDVADALAGAKEILVVGPATAKLEFLRYAHRRAPQLEARIRGVETVDHPTDGQLVAFAKRYFEAADRMGST